MLCDLIIRLATDTAFRAAVAREPERSLAPFGATADLQRILMRTALRLQAGAVPPCCYYWWGPQSSQDVDPVVTLRPA